jgi:hypothetical protein
LLHISTGIFVEDYKRFYLRDIQSLTVHKSNFWIVVNVGLAALTVVFAALTAAFADLARVIAGVASIAWALILAVNYFRGPGCVCYIQTAVQRQKLRSISRIKRAQKIMDSLKPIIVSYQQER